MSKIRGNLYQLIRQGDLWLVFAVFGVILLLILPVSPLILDVLLAVSIAISLLIVLVILYLREPSDFTGFPTLLLFVTLFRLSLNVASTRLILLDGYAGQIIETFGNFVVRGNFVVGMVVFTILVLINFIVITKGAGRIAEVAARFTLDAMPGKQMAIDAELNAGLIDEAAARNRRQKVEQEADFYGAMDGASKFVRGDAIAAILITLINIIGRFGIGMVQRGMGFADALGRYTLLSIGDSLVSQIPALIISTAAGILVTRAAAKNDLGDELGKQLLNYPKALKLLAVLLIFMGIIPGMPLIPFLILAGSSYAVARTLKAAAIKAKKEAAGPEAENGDGIDPAQVAAAKTPSADNLEQLLSIDTMQIELGYGVVNLADKRKGGNLLERVTGIRRNFAQDMGVIIPPIRIKDNLQMGANEYRFLVMGNEVCRSELMPGHWLAMNATNSSVQLKGVPTIEPVFELPATWITDVERKNAEVAGYTVVDAASVMVTHLSEVIKRQCHELLTRQDVQKLLDNLKETHPTVVNELIPEKLNVGHIQRILQNLLAEGIPIKNLAGILERISDQAEQTKNPDELSEFARRGLASVIVGAYQRQSGQLQAITLDPRLEQSIAQGIRQNATEITLSIEPGLARHIVEKMSEVVKQMVAQGLPPIVICAPQIRLAFRRFFEATFKELTVLSYLEIPPKTEVQTSVIIPAP